MDKILGVPTTGLMYGLLVGLALCLLSVAWVAWRRPVIFKLGVRNIPRRRAQTSLIVAGLMLSTMIITAALGTGDTVNRSITGDVYTNLGQVDELVVASHDGEALTDLLAIKPLAPDALARVQQAAQGNADIDGLLPMLDMRVPVQHGAKNLAEPAAVLTGLDTEALARFGGLEDARGRTINLDAAGGNAVVLSEKLAKDIKAAQGDTITVFIQDTPHQVTVAGVATNSYLSGARRGRGSWLEVPGMAMSLSALQSLASQPGQINAIAVSNRGGERDGLKQADAVNSSLRAALAGTGLGVDPIKADRVDQAEQTGTEFTTVFMVLGLFSIASGLLLIVLIFSMLASERRSEMGMERAVGAQRRQLIQQFIAEGAGYTLVAGLVGAALGVLAAVGMAEGMKAIFGDYAPIEPHIEPRSVLVAYCMGVVITFLTVAGSSWRVSKLNIVAAIRDIQDVSAPKRRWRTLGWAALLTAGGAVLAQMGAGSDKLLLFGAGMNLMPFGVALALRFFAVPGRLVYSVAGAWVLAFWLMPDGAFESLFGAYENTIADFVVSGLLMVVGSTVLVINNTDILMAAITRFGGLFRPAVPAIRTAVAYPAAAKSRTGLTIAMFSLIIFSLVMMASMSQNFASLELGDESNAGWHIRADALGDTPVVDFAGTLRERGVDIGRFTAIGRVTNPSDFSSEVRVAGAEDQTWKQYPVYGMDQRFIEASALLFGQRAEGYATDADIVAALRSNPNLAVVDSGVLESDDIGGDPDQFMLKGLKTSEKVFAPRQIELADPRTGTAHTVTVIGILDNKIGTLSGVYTNQETIDAIYGQAATTSYYVALTGERDAEAMAKQIESALLSSSVQAVSVHQELKDAQKQESGFLYIIQGFMGLGLLVGIAAIGVIAFRAVVERRQQIGMLRAIGYQSGTVALSFLIETAFIVGIGAISGTLLGLQLARKLFISEAGSDDAVFTAPWPMIAVMLVGTIGMALVMTWLPSRQAGRVAPAEALRYE